jgi:uncharacterized protein
MERRFTTYHLIIILVFVFIILIAVISTTQFTMRKEYEPPTALSEYLPRYRLIDMDNIHLQTDIRKEEAEISKKILNGAKDQLKAPSKNIFIEGSGQSNYYQGGDPPIAWAISTDIVARAYMKAGIELRVLINEDIKENYEEYPLRAIWRQSYPDIDIDYRRIQNMEVFFKRNAKSLTPRFDPADINNLNSWVPGDIVFFDMARDGFTDTVGVVSDNTTRNGSPKIIYNHVDPGFTVEEDILSSTLITGHYRYP